MRSISKSCLKLLVFVFFVGSSVAPGHCSPSLTVEESVVLALKQSPQARAARYTRDVAQVQADRDKPVARPTVNVTASGTGQVPRVTFPRPDGTNATVLPEAFGQVSLTVEQPLYRAGLGAAKRRYTAQSGAAELDYQRTLADLALAARKACYDVLKAESGVRAAKDGLEAAERYGALVKRQIEAGQAKPVDAETVAAQVAEAQAGLTQAEGGLTLAKLNYNRTLGRPLTTPVVLEAPSGQPVVPDSPDTAITAALQNRPEIALLDENRIAARAGVSLAKTQSQPTLSVRGQATQQTKTAFLPSTYLAATLELRWPLLDAGKTRQDTREAQAQAQRLDALLEDTQQGIALEVAQAWQKMREARDRITLAQTQRHGAEATAVVAEKAYEVGRGTVIEVQGAQREVRLAKEREIQATYDLYAAAADFAHAQGNALPPDTEKAR